MIRIKEITERERVNGIIQQTIAEGVPYEALVRSVCLGIKREGDPTAVYPLDASECCVFAGCPYVTGGHNELPSTVHIQDYRCGLADQIGKKEDPRHLIPEITFSPREIPPPVPISEARLNFLETYESAGRARESVGAR